VKVVIQAQAGEVGRVAPRPPTCLLIRLKQPFATFIESVAVAALLQSDEQTLHGLDPINRRLQLCQFSLGQFSPTVRCPGATGETKKQFSDFTQSEAGSARTLYHSKPVERCCIVTSLPTRSLNRRKYSDLFVIANS
jgi:hypothetical protein